MKCEKRFRKFHHNISLKQSRVDRIASAVSALRKFVSEDSSDDDGEPGIADVLNDFFLQGSYAMGTAVRPANEDEEYDVDVMLALALATDGEDLPSGEQVLLWLQRRLEGNPDYEGKTSVGHRCVRIDFAGEFHLDVVAAIPKKGKGTSLWIPDADGGWQETDPKGLMRWFADCGSGRDGKLERTVMYLKWWRSIHDIEIKSVVLTALLGDHAHQGKSDAEALVATMESLDRWLGRRDDKPRVNHPTVGCDMAENWTQDEYEEFRDEFHEATVISRDALDEEDEEESVALWREVFGEQFPKHVPREDGKSRDKKAAIPTEADVDDLRTALKQDLVGASASAGSVYVASGSRRRAVPTRPWRGDA